MEKLEDRFDSPSLSHDCTFSRAEKLLRIGIYLALLTVCKNDYAKSCVNRRTLRFILRHNREGRDLRNASLGNRISTPARNPLFFHWKEIVPSSVVIETVESKRITKRWEKHGWLPRPRFVVDGLQIVLCDDRRPEEPANISRRTIGRGSIRIPGTNERSIGGHR